MSTHIVSNNDRSQTILHLANAAFRNGHLVRAIGLYEQAMREVEEPFRNRIRFNIELALRRLGGAQSIQNSKIVHNQMPSLAYYNQPADSDSSDEDFLMSLFYEALGRPPADHEEMHYEGQLRNGLYDRELVARIVYRSEERQTYIKDWAQKRCRPQQYDESATSAQLHPYDIDLPYHESPVVSVLIPIYGKIDYTLACLKSISDNPPKARIEIIVLDDQSPDSSALILNKISSIRVIQNPVNLGFLRSCNNGANHTRGEYLFFLNNDTLVTPGWLDELLNTFRAFPNCGLAGSKLIYPDGRLQEAGGIVWRDGSAWNYGNRDDPNLPQYNYARQADYISGAAVMMPANLFREMRGFDERYAPAYYEDTDLAMRIRKRGMSVIYQPRSEVIHFEGVTSGTDTTGGVKKYQVANREKFLARWKEHLLEHRPNGTEPHLERDRGAVRRVLFIDACTPTPDQDSGSIDIYNMMKVFVDMGWAVTFIPEDNYAYMDKYTPAIQRIGVQALYYPHVRSVDEHINEFGDTYNLVMLFRPITAEKHINNVRQKCAQAKIIYNTVDLHFLRLAREAEIKSDLALKSESARIKEMELTLMKKADLSTVISTIELKMLQRYGIERVVHLPFSREMMGLENPYENRSGLIFVGGFQHSPNVDAIHYFVAEVMPLLRRRLPGILLHVVGSNTPPEVAAMARSDVIVHGFVEDLEPLLRSVRLNVAPLRYGAGTKGKVVQAMCAGLPTVGTKIAFEGMAIEIKDCIAKNENDMSEKIVKLYQDRDLWNQCASEASEIARKEYSVGTLRQNITKILLEIERL